MPFDAMNTSTLQGHDGLKAMGITPLSTALVNAHKRRVEARSPGIRPSSWLFYSVPGMGDDMFANLATLHWLPERLARDLSGAPSKLIKLAIEVNQKVEDPIFGVAVYADDPILYVTYGPNHNRRSACLGIWMKRTWLGALVCWSESRLVAIAETVHR